ncbi:MAG: DUF3822 family protein [Muribaculaceae bacterium]|nr:DUF3822 family protein [Muribaculaceae bacterium]
MEQQALNKDLISNPRLWRLAIRINENKVHIVLLCSVEDNSLIYREIPLDSATLSQQKALEEVIYDNPLLLSDFDKIDCIIESNKFTIVPTEINDIDTQEKIFKASFPNFEGTIIDNNIAELNATILMGVDNEIINFLRRTFNNPRILHHLTPLCTYFHRKNRLGNTGKMYANIHDNHIDLLSFNKDSLQLANTFEFREPIDAIYYILACRQMLKLDPESDELFIAGNNDIREAITPTLREYLAYVMPIIFPAAMFKAGKDALNAPFDLIILPLCE